MFDILNGIVFTAVISGAAGVVVDVFNVIAGVGEEVIKQRLVVIQDVGGGAACSPVAAVTVSLVIGAISSSTSSEYWVWMIREIETVLCAIL